MILLTVFTPAYNRAHTLPRTYKSLLDQDCKDFIWMIIDDGSTDHTKELVREWQEKDNGFEIQYIYKENGGMHTAHNTAYEHIKTELNMCIDSDDCVAKGAIRKILNKWEMIKNDNYAGIIGLDSDLNGNIIGKGFPSEMQETTLCGYYAKGGAGDKKLVYRTEVINKYPPYPVFEGEKYVALAYKYRLIDQDYKLVVLNEVLCNVEYQEDGSSNNMYKQYVSNPNGFLFWRKICLTYPNYNKSVFFDAIHYVCDSLLANKYDIIRDSPRRFISALAYPFGWLLFIYIKCRCKYESDK